MAKASNEKVSLTENGRRKTRSKREVAAIQLVNRGATGDLPALRLLSQLEARDAGEADTPAAAALGERDREIVARLLERLRDHLACTSQETSR